MTLRRFLVVAVAAAALPACRVEAQATLPVRRFVQVAIAPDGKRVGWIGPPSRARTAAANSVVLADAGPSGLTNIVPLPGADGASASEITWSPDGSLVGILATTNGGTPAFYVPPRVVMERE